METNKKDDQARSGQSGVPTAAPRDYRWSSDDLLDLLKDLRIPIAASAQASHLMDGLPASITGKPEKPKVQTRNDHLLQRVDAAITSLIEHPFDEELAKYRTITPCETHPNADHEWVCLHPDCSYAHAVTADWIADKRHAFNAGYLDASQAIRVGTINDAWDRFIAKFPALHAWQPIATAPKDADVLLLYLDGSGVHPGYWDDDRWLACETQGLTGGRWFADPTHWMPLPDPPSTDPAVA